MVVHSEKSLILLSLGSVLSVYPVACAAEITTEYTENTEKTLNNFPPLREFKLNQYRLKLKY